MKNGFGNALTVTLFGESHGPAVGCVLDGLAPGIPVDEEAIAARMALRHSLPELSSARREDDRVVFLSGVANGRTTGTPLALIIENHDTRGADYEKVAGFPRPGHADFTNHEKYHGYADLPGGGHSSGRLTAPLCAAGAIVSTALAARGITIATHIARLGGIEDRPFADLAADAATLNAALFPVLDEKAATAMRAAILAARDAGDSLGGVLETAVTGLPAGLGEPWFDTVEGLLSHALFSIPAVKGVEFGDGFALADRRGSEANDAFRVEDGVIRTVTNHAGGVLGGITDGMPVLFRTAVKPTPSIARPQETVDLSTGKSATVCVDGRHDPAVVHRARAAVDAVTALVTADLLTQRYGTDFLAKN